MASAFVGEWVARFGVLKSLHCGRVGTFGSRILLDQYRNLEVPEAETILNHLRVSVFGGRANPTIKIIFISRLKAK